MTALFAAGVVMGATAAAHAEYRLQAGDVLDVSVVGVPELHSKATVDLDGGIAFPMIGSVNVQGATLDDVRDKVAKLLDTKGSLASGNKLSQIPANQVMISIAEYRPVYLIGDVARSGAQPFRPGLTVRQALSLAGGVDPNRGKANPSGLSSADQYSSLWIDYAREQARVWRLERERGNRNEEPGKGLFTPSAANSAVVGPNLDGSPLPRDVLSQISNAEADQFALSQSGAIKERTFLSDSLNKIDRQIALLAQQQDRERHEADLDNNELQRLQTYYRSGLATMQRISSARQQAFAMTSQIAQTTSSIAQTERERADIGLKLQKLDNDHRMTVVRDLEDANVQLAKIRSRLQTIGDDVISIADRPGAGPGQKNWSISIVHQTDPVSTPVAATEDTPLQPGDVVQIMVGSGGIGSRSPLGLTRVEALAAPKN